MTGRHLLFEKGAATSLAFRPSYWSYEAVTQNEGFPLNLESTTKAVAAQETTDAGVRTPSVGEAPTVEDQAQQQALTAGLAEIIDSILRTRQFATRGIHEAFRKRATTQTVPVEQFAIADAIASALRAELARAKADPDAEARPTRPLIDLVLGFIGLGERTASAVVSGPVRDR